MELSNTPRKYLVGLIAVIMLILVVITSLNPGTLSFKDNSDYKAQLKQAQKEAEQYEQLLASIEPNYEASQQLLEKIATEEVVRKEVEATLQVNQKVAIPTISNSELAISDRNDRPAMLDYFNKVKSIFANYNNDILPVASKVYGEEVEPAEVQTAEQKTKVLTQNLRGLPVPPDAVELHKAYVASYDTYGKFFATTAQYEKGEIENPWPNVYGQYAIIDNRLELAEKEIQRVTQKYALDVPLPEDIKNSNGFALIKTAHAAFPVVDVEDVLWKAIRTGMARSFARFSVKMIDKLVAHIEKSFAIASQLYYSQDLGRFYSEEYMKKFVADPTEQDIIKKFLPQYFCVNPDTKDFKKIFTAKAMTNQGTDIVLDPNDPQFVTKLARLGGDKKNYPNWWEDYYSSLAAQTQQAAEAAATKEVLSPGLKTGRDMVNGQINKAMSSVFNVQAAALSQPFALGSSNAENEVGTIIAGIIDNMVSKFIFTPIAGGSSNGEIGVIPNQNVCLRNPKMKPVVAVPSSKYEPETIRAPQPQTPLFKVETPPFVPRN